MLIWRQGRKFIQTIVFGDTLLPQAFTIGLAEPQTEIAVWLHGMGTSFDVTYRHSMACADPFTVCISFDQRQDFPGKTSNYLVMKFCERGGRQRVLGEISLDIKSATVIKASGTQLMLFQALSSKNNCLPKMQVFAHYLRHRYLLWRKADIPGVKMSFLDRRAVMVMFIRPHPVVLLSLCGEDGGNMFPMNIMGNLDGGYFSFALKESKLAAHLVERAGRVALSSVPLLQTVTAYKLGVNHNKQSIDWTQLPFEVKRSSVFNIPIPVFTHRVRELKIETVSRIGSHMFFVARMVHDEIFTDSAGLCIVHGFYQAWRLKGRRAELEASLEADMLNKRGMPHDPSPI
jgi:flavin reductase (DIM6/NTAB) family NADH-FMN oxidoreductase RutF